MRHQLAIPRGSNIKNSTMTRPKLKGRRAVARLVAAVTWLPTHSDNRST